MGDEGESSEWVSEDGSDRGAPRLPTTNELVKQRLVPSPRDPFESEKESPRRSSMKRERNMTVKLDLEVRQMASRTIVGVRKNVRLVKIRPEDPYRSLLRSHE